ncbi:hypothetical protein Hanom_Chr04g00385481 [Helianthus anomalus]
MSTFQPSMHMTHVNKLIIPSIHSFSNQRQQQPRTTTINSNNKKTAAVVLKKETHKGDLENLTSEAPKKQITFF